MFVRGNRKDYDSWEEMGAKGWGFDGVLPYFKKLEDNQDPEYVANGKVFEKYHLIYKNKLVLQY